MSAAHPPHRTRPLNRPRDTAPPLVSVPMELEGMSRPASSGQASGRAAEVSHQRDPNNRPRTGDAGARSGVRRSATVTAGSALVDLVSRRGDRRRARAASAPVASAPARRSAPARSVGPVVGPVVTGGGLVGGTTGPPVGWPGPPVGRSVPPGNGLLPRPGVRNGGKLAPGDSCENDCVGPGAGTTEAGSGPGVRPPSGSEPPSGLPNASAAATDASASSSTPAIAATRRSRPVLPAGPVGPPPAGAARPRRRVAPR